MSCIVAIASCGCIRAAAVAEGSKRYREAVAKDVARWLLDGYKVERREDEQVRVELGTCPHKTASPKQGSLL